MPRARFTVDEVVKLTIDFYRRNYIEGLFLSSGIIRSADYTMEQVVSVARKLREEHHFRGYIHLKTIPEADDALITEAGKYADRLSINIEVPEESSLAKLAPEKDVRAIRRTMGRLRLKLDEAQGQQQQTATKAKPPRFAPAGQSTQMIIGADAPTTKPSSIPAPISTAPTNSSASIIPPSARSRMPAARCRCQPRRWSASTGFIRPTG